MIRAALISFLLIGSASAVEPITLKILSINSSNVVVGGFTTGRVYKVASFDSLVSPVWTWTATFTASVSSVVVPRSPSRGVSYTMPAGWYGVDPFNPSSTNLVWIEEYSGISSSSVGYIRAWDWPADSVSAFSSLCSAFVWSARLGAVLIGFLLFRFVSLRAAF